MKILVYHGVSSNEKCRQLIKYMAELIASTEMTAKKIKLYITANALKLAMLATFNFRY